jgi:hypothetical protein
MLSPGSFPGGSTATAAITTVKAELDDVLDCKSEEMSQIQALVGFCVDQGL